MSEHIGMILRSRVLTFRHRPLVAGSGGGAVGPRLRVPAGSSPSGAFIDAGARTIGIFCHVFATTIFRKRPTDASSFIVFTSQA